LFPETVRPVRLMFTVALEAKVVPETRTPPALLPVKVLLLTDRSLSPPLEATLANRPPALPLAVAKPTSMDALPGPELKLLRLMPGRLLSVAVAPLNVAVAGPSPAAVTATSMPEPRFPEAETAKRASPTDPLEKLVALALMPPLTPELSLAVTRKKETPAAP